MALDTVQHSDASLLNGNFSEHQHARDPPTVTSTPIITMPALIEKKREHHTLAQREIEAFVALVASGAAAPSQIGAMLMAIYLNGLDDLETAHLTRAMARSGTVLDWSDCEFGADVVVVDKHSTGGVGDKVSLVLAPVLAACGLKVPMVSGRGLGHTGGTIDKLESIPGFNAKLSSGRIKQIVRRVGCCITGQAADMAPVDGILYAIRDVTSTVACAPLITASILSKKAAEGVAHLLMDVKFGRGAFAATLADAEEQARLLVATGATMGMPVTAVFTEMDNPIGHTIGSALEVVEALACLRGGGPPDLMELIMVQAAVLLLGAHEKCRNFNSALIMAAEAVSSGRALEKFGEMLVQQDVAPEIAARLCNPELPLSAATDMLPKTPYQTAIRALSSGTLASIDARAISVALRPLGAGRLTPNDAINHGVGVELLRDIGQQVVAGDLVVLLHHDVNDSNNVFQQALGAMQAAIEISSCTTVVADAVIGYDDSYMAANILNRQRPTTTSVPVCAKRRRVAKIQTHLPYTFPTNS